MRINEEPKGHRPKGPRPSSARTKAHTISDNSQSTLALAPDAKPSTERALYSSKVKSKRYYSPTPRGVVTTIKKEDKAALRNIDRTPKPPNTVATSLQPNDSKQSLEAAKQPKVVITPHKSNTEATPAPSNVSKDPVSSDGSAGNDPPSHDASGPYSRRQYRRLQE